MPRGSSHVLLPLLVAIALPPVVVVVVAMLHEIEVDLLPALGVPKQRVFLQRPMSGILEPHILDLHPYELGLPSPGTASCCPT
jgi:hypothetical protein